jgi:hypothetical protein
MSLLHTSIGVVVALAIWAYVTHTNDLSVQALVCQDPVPGVPWMNMAAILLCLASLSIMLNIFMPVMTVVITSVIPMLTHILLSILVCGFIAYVVFMSVMGIMGPPDTRKHVLELADNLVRLPAIWLRFETQTITKGCYVF